MFDFILPLTKGALILLFVVFVAFVSMYLFGSDNEIEQAAEEIFSRETGQKVDFSPGNKGGK